MEERIREVGKAEEGELKSVRSIVLPKLVSQPLPAPPLNQSQRAAKVVVAALERARDDSEERERIELASEAALAGSRAWLAEEAVPVVSQVKGLRSGAVEQLEAAMQAIQRENDLGVKAVEDGKAVLGLEQVVEVRDSVVARETGQRAAEDERKEWEREGVEFEESSVELRAADWVERRLVVLVVLLVDELEERREGEAGRQLDETVDLLEQPRE